MTDLDEEIRTRLERKRRRTVDLTAQSSAINPRLEDLLGLLNASKELQLQGITARAETGKIALQKHGKPYGEWLIHDAWFEYRTRDGVEEQIYKAAWTEQAIALTSSIVTGLHGHGQRANAEREHARLTFSVRQERGSAPTVTINLVDEIPSLGRRQLTFTLPDGTDFEGARRIARHLNRDVVALTIQRRNRAS